MIETFKKHAKLLDFEGLLDIQRFLFICNSMLIEIGLKISF